MGMLHQADASSLSAVGIVAFVFKNPQERAHRGIARRLGEPRPDVGRRRAACAVEKVHDLPLAAAQVREL